METIEKNIIRIGNFTSSRIGLLMKKGRGGERLGQMALSYINEKKMERRLGRTLDSDSGNRATSWGKFVEGIAFNKLGTEYQLISQKTVEHKNYTFWVGSQDGLKFDEGQTVIDIKCPYTLKSFVQFADCTTIEEVRKNHKDGDMYYWQLVSNAIITGSKYAELIVYCPYQKELAEIREETANYIGDQNKVAWIQWAQDEELPYLPNDGYYKNINIIRFEVKEEDKELLTSTVVDASKILLE